MLPIGTWREPGPGAMPVGVALVALALGVALVARGGSAPPLGGVGWSEAPRALVVVAALAFLALAFERLGYRFSVFATVLFLVGAVERRSPLAAVVYAGRPRLGQLLSLQHAPEGAAAARARSGSDARCSRRSRTSAWASGRAAAGRALVRLRRLPGRHAGRRPAGRGTAGRDQPAAPRDLWPRRHARHRHARRHLLRRDVRGLHDVDPDAHPRRGRLGHDVHRRLRDGAQGARGRRRSPSPRWGPTWRGR